MLKKTIAAFLVALVITTAFGLDVTRVVDLCTIWLAGPDAPAPETIGTVQPQSLTVAGKAVCIGEGQDALLAKFGEAQETYPSEYGFTWYAFHEEYADFVQCGLSREGRVVAVYTNSPEFSFAGITYGAAKEDVRLVLGDVLDSIVKDGVRYFAGDETSRGQSDLFLYQGMYITVFYDLFKNNTVTSIHIIEEGTELAFSRLYGEPSLELARAFSRQNFLAVNAVRVREGYAPFRWSEEAERVALGHSADMAQNNYFAHESPDGRTVSDRFREAGVSASAVAENLAAGGQNGIYMHELLMNSEGHRSNVFCELEYLGVAVAFSGEGRPYLTQNFYTPPRPWAI